MRVEDPIVEYFASGWKQHYYGKGDVIVYRLIRDGSVPAGRSAVFGASVLMLLYGEAFWSTYTTGDNTGLIATDSLKNFIQRETLHFKGHDFEGLCRFLADKFLATYPQVEGLQVSATEIPYDGFEGGVAFTPSRPDRAMARIEVGRQGVIEAVSGVRGFKLLRLGGSAFHGFVRDEYTTLPDMMNRPLHMWLDLDWRYTDAEAAFNDGQAVAQVRRLVTDVFCAFESGSIQQLIHTIGSRMLDQMPAVRDVHLEANNRTWDTIVEQGDALGVYTDSRPPYGCLGLRLTR
jgi:urate oxidase/2-oxo-4-hydroxy-4-carboxy-5-ureidoimidazoline decarboxylase